MAIDVRTDPPVGRRPNPSATRYLSAGAYLDPHFRTRVVETVLNKEHTAVAPSYSIDVVPILKHCLAAVARQRIADRLVAGVVLICLLISFWQVVFLASLVYGLVSLARALASFGNRKFGSGIFWLWLTFVLLSAAAASADTILNGVSFAGSASVLFGAGRLVLTLLLALIGTTVALAWHRVSIHQTLLDGFTEEQFQPEAAPAPPQANVARIAYLAGAQHGNVTIYGQSRRENPFLGCGPVTEGWSLALPLVPDPNQDREPEPLTVTGLYRSMRLALVSLANPQDDEEQRIKGLSLQQRIFVSGLLPRNHSLLDERRQPRLDISQSEVDLLSQDERSRSTQLLTVRVNGWDGELDVTVSLYFSVRGNMLYTEFTACTLAPISANYHQIDTLDLMGSQVYVRAGLGALLAAPAALIRCPLNVINPVIEAVQRSFDLRGQLQRISSQLAFDYGATTSVRELGADTNPSNLFHQYDSDRYIKTVNRRVIEAITEVLELHGYSNDDFVRRTNFYIDQSTNISDSRNVTVANGPGARAESYGGPAPSAPPARTTGAAR